MKNFIISISLLFCVGPFAVAHEGYDPSALAKEQPSQYTEYLHGLFENQTEIKTSSVTASPKLRKGTFAYTFRSEIKKQSRLKNANFAGEWILVVVGQGTGAFRYFLTNAKTGEVIDPDLMTTNGKPLFRSDRSLLVISGSVGEKTLDDAKKGVWGGPKAFAWKNNRFESVPL